MSFSGDVKRWTTKAKGNRDTVITLSFQRLATKIVERTPLGDWTTWKIPVRPEGYRPGTLANSWFAGFGEVPGGLRTREPNLSAADSLSNIRAVAKMAPGKLVHLANPAPYARRVEYGWSKQRPQGMVRTTVAEFKTIVAKAVRDAT